jgi:hypothetical protein
MNTLILLALIKALTQEVNLLELQLAQLEASSTVAVVTTTPIVFPAIQTSTWTPSTWNPSATEQTSTPLLGDAEPTASCALTATNVGDDNSPQTYMTWTLNGLPTSTMADVQGVRINVNPWDYSSSTHQFSVLATTTENWHLQNEPVGAFPNQNILLVSGWFQSLTADFNGTDCSVNPYWNQ